MMLAWIASKHGLPVFYFIAPQVWVWGKIRLKLLTRIVNKMFVILPFEKEIYENAGMDVEFVGHPFIGEVKTALERDKAYKIFGLDKNQKIIGILPGSRNQEIKTLLPVMLESVRIIKKEIPTAQFVLPLAKTIKNDEVSGPIKLSGLEIKVIEGFTYDVISMSDLLIVASGSVTLEAAILKKPMIIVYKLHLMTYILARLVCHISTIGLVNIIAGKEVVPELHQGNATSENITSWVLKALTDKKYYERMKLELAEIEPLLGGKGAAQTTAKSIINYLYEEKSL
jgi:lipid-A-disaccharide synthase